MINKLKVGIPIIGSQSWLGGVSHMELHVKAVTSLEKANRPQLFLLITAESAARLPLYQPFIHLFDGAVYLGDKDTVLDICIPVMYAANEEELFKQIDFYFPVNFNVLPGRPAASWIHDFQHKYLPQLFSKQDIAIRNELCSRVAKYSKLIFCSSFAVEKDFHTFFPESKAITRVLSLRVSPEYEWYNGNPQEVQEKYKLPERFILCSNQFWLHKNHKLLFKAIHLLHEQGTDVHLVCTGETGDFRRPQYFSELKEDLVSLGIGDLVHILGRIERSDQIQLLRRSLFVVQPSLFEGLGLIVQECQALGKNIVVSDLDVHKEHHYGLYFKRHDAEDLALKISELLKDAFPGPNLEEEAKAKEKAAVLVREYAGQFCELVKDAQRIFFKQPEKIQNEKVPPSKAIATSLRANGDIEEQQKVVESWLALGFTVYSVNHSQDIIKLSSIFPEVTFVRSKYVKGHMGDILGCLYNTQAGICAVASPYTYLFGKAEGDLFQENEKAIFYIKTKKLESVSCRLSDQEYISSVLFFSKEALGMRSANDLFLEEPWWHLWLMMVFLSKKYKLKRLESLTAYQLAGKEKVAPDEALVQGGKVAASIPAPFTLDAASLIRYQHLLWEVAKKNTVE